MFPTGRLTRGFISVLCLAGCGRIGFDEVDLVLDDANMSDASSGGGVSSGGYASNSGGTTSTGGASTGAASTGGAMNDIDASSGGGTTSTGGAALGGGGTTSGGGTAGSGGAAGSGGLGAAGGAVATGGTSSTCTSTASCTCASYGGHDYWFCTASDGVTAEGNCESAGMVLARVDDAPENDWLRATADATVGALDLYMGAQDSTQSSTWQWRDGAVFWIGKDTCCVQAGMYAHWMAGRPQGSAIRTCALIASAGQWSPSDDGFWYDSGCGLVRPYVCEAY